MDMYDVHQRTVDGLLDAGELLYQRTRAKGCIIKDLIEEFLSLKSTKDFIETISSRESCPSEKIVKCVSQSGGRENIRIADFESVKELSGKGKDEQRYYFHPLLYIEFAMWISQEFKYNVLKSVLDNESVFANNLTSKTY